MAAPERVYRTEGVVLRRFDLGEADRIITLYTRTHGKIKAVAKGVRKPTSRKAGHLELFTRVDLLVAQGHSLDVISQAQMMDAFLPLRTDLFRSTYGGHFVELLDAFTEEGDDNPGLYGLLVSGLRWLCTTSDLSRTARYYELHILDGAGYRPELSQCVGCGNGLKPVNQFYSPVEGGVICPDCAQNYPRGRSLSLNALKVLRYMQSQSFESIDQIAISAGVLADLERLLHDTLTYHLERRLKSAAFLQRLRRENSAAG